MTRKGKYNYDFDQKEVLVVEDNLISFKLMEAMFSRVNLKMIHAADGETAIELCRTHPEINIVLMDMQLPVMGGIEATKVISDIRPGLPVIATTANSFAEDKEACLKAGCSAYMTKPIAFEKLFSLIQSILNQGAL